MEQAEKVIEAFVKAGDNRDVAALESILHHGFQNIQDGFFDERGIFVFSKSDYIELIRTKRFGGSPRRLIINNIKQSDNMAIARVILESQFLIFHSLIICIRDNGHWKIINNTPTIEVK
ncbi:nuclear transport factor 2 family protein [Sphingobacterium chuzhouense]|uniref:Nuclear transport factor 2 family protein n=1 Tax=Sphingobacterium chuzhouense TaxID=1742264 RepID=A0ABR7XV88_9SPHI|nr:nuclear transport factor 2 family protein [Sphingobacterium chuzhouense]MBD1422943.1 nuclear transport factor 2 family protein [Sphingobacterium chuzhouense]